MRVRARYARRRALALLGLVACLHAPGAGADVVEVRTGEHRTFTRLVVELTRAGPHRVESSHRVETSRATPRLSIEVHSPLATDAAGSLPGAGLITATRVSAPSPSTTRVDATLRAPCRVVRVFTLAPSVGIGPRIVVDLERADGVGARAPQAPHERVGTARAPAAPAPEFAPDLVAPPRRPHGHAASGTGATPQRRGTARPALALSTSAGLRRDRSVEQSPDFLAAPAREPRPLGERDGRTVVSRQRATARPSGLVAGSAPGEASGGSFADWSLRGSLAVRAEHYDVTGNPDFSPYFAEGGHSYGELDLELRRVVSPYEEMRARTFALLNGSSYRRADRGLMAEELAFEWEKGDAPVPYRLELGDFFAYQTFRTIHRSLKGAQLELQPRAGRRGRRQSWLFFAGSRAGTYQQLAPDDDLLSGASWQLDDRALGTFTVNLTHARQRAGPDASGPVLLQHVASATGYRELTALGQRLEFEGEVARFSGDASAARTGRSDTAVFAQVLGRSQRLPLSYRLRFERYGEDFAPAEAVVGPDRRSVEARAAWQFDAGPQLRGRLQSFRTGLESPNPLDTETIGLSLVGPWRMPDGRFATIDADAFVQRVRNRDRSTRTLVRSAEVDARIPVSDRWTGRIGMFGQASDDHTPGGDARVTREIELGAQRLFDFGGHGATVEPGMLLRTVRGAGENRSDFGPRLTMSLWGSSYTLDAWYFHLLQDRHAPGTIDSASDTFGLFFTWWRDLHFLELEANYDRFDQDPGGRTDSYRFSLQYTYYFSRPARRAPATATAAPLTGAAARDGQLALTQLAPGTSLDAARERLAAAGLVGGIERPGTMEYHTRALFPDVDRRQRLVLRHSAGVVESVAVLIDSDARGSPRSVAELHDAMRGTLLRRHGNPDRVLERGDFGPGLTAALAEGRFLRASEWHLPGGLLRFGIPRRRDGEVHLEARIARTLPAARSGNWSLVAPR